MKKIIENVKQKLTIDFLEEYLLNLGYSTKDLDLLEAVLHSSDQEPFSIDEITDKILHEICLTMMPIMEDLKNTYKNS